MWNRDSLKELVQKKFNDYQFILVSNREPYMHIYRGGEVEVIMPASGMAIALDSLMQTTGGTWVAAGSLHQGIQGDGHPAGGHNDLHLPAPVDMHIGFPVGHQDELVITKLSLHQFL